MSRLSKRLSYILRHKPETVGFIPGKGDWVDIDELCTAMTQPGSSHMTEVIT